MSDKRKGKKRQSKKNRGDKKWIYIAAAVAALLIIFGIFKLATRKAPQNDDSSSDSSVLSLDTSEDVSKDEGGEFSDETSHQGDSSDLPDDGSSVQVSEPTAQQGNSQTSNGDYITQTASGAAEADAWYLQIASVAHPIPEDFVQPATTVIDSQGREIDSRIVGAYKDMVSAAKADGINIFPISAFRPHSTQVNLFNNRVNQARAEGYSDPEAEAARHVAKPGTSEHELGLAIDFNSVDEETFRHTAEAKWLAEHCTEYGFIIRYPEEKQSVTGIIYEPWHVRFVGVTHAKRMKQLNMCLEEYVDYIRSGNS